MKQIRIVDAHMHLGAPMNLFTHGWKLPDILRLMDRLGIDRAYSMHHLWLAGRLDEARSASVYAYEFSGGRIPFMGVFDPNMPDESLDAMDRCLDHHGFIGIKVHPSFHGVPADDEKYAVLWKYAGRHGKPIVSHTWSDTYNPVQKLSLPRLFEGYVKGQPNVTFVLGHAGGPGSGRDQAVHLANEYPNVYMDVSGDVFCLNQISALVDAVGPEKVMFGTDQPWVDPRAHLARVFLARIPDEAKEKILSTNALRVYEPHLLNAR